MSWLKNLIEYNEKGVVEKCPKCNSSKVEVTKHEHGKRLSFTFECKNCGSFDHFDGAKD